MYQCNFINRCCHCDCFVFLISYIFKKKIESKSKTIKKKRRKFVMIKQKISQMNDVYENTMFLWTICCNIQIIIICFLILKNVMTKLFLKWMIATMISIWNSSILTLTSWLNVEMKQNFIKQFFNSFNSTSISRHFFDFCSRSYSSNSISLKIVNSNETTQFSLQHQLKKNKNDRCDEDWCKFEKCVCFSCFVLQLKKCMKWAIYKLNNSSTVINEIINRRSWTFCDFSFLK